MPLKSETTDMLGYYDDSWHTPKREGVNTFALALARSIEAWARPHERWPVRNRQERTPISSQKRAIIHARDGDVCRLCGIDGVMLTVDHIIPRSAFDADQLEIADRSDNLISACWPCNEAKSNYERPQRKRLGVVVHCWYCKAPEFDDDGRLPYPRKHSRILRTLRRIACTDHRRVGPLSRPQPNTHLEAVADAAASVVQGDE